MQNEVLVTVVTVCFNSEYEIDDTIQSVYDQTDREFEYLIVDGKSTDHTAEKAKNWSEKFDEKGIDYTVISEKDSGIYNAMNKAVKLSRGKYVIFMNAGDCFYSEHVLLRVKAYLQENSLDALFGHTINKQNNLYHLEKALIDNEHFVFTHQSVFTRREYLMESPYDESYRYAADTDCYMNMYRSNKRIRVIEDIISIYDIGGVSSTWPCYVELQKIKRKYHYPYKECSDEPPVRKSTFKHRVGQILPEKIRDSLMRYREEKRRNELISAGWSTTIEGAAKSQR